MADPVRSPTSASTLTAGDAEISHFDFWGLSYADLCKWDEKKVRSCCTDLGLPFKNLTQGQQIISKFCGIEMEVKQRDNTQKLIDYLNQQMRRKRLCELHTHFIGMGSDDFWYTEIMTQRLPLLLYPNPSTVKERWDKMLNACYNHLEPTLRMYLKEKIRATPAVDMLDKDMLSRLKAAGMKMDDDEAIKNFILKWFCTDVVYGLDKLCTAFHPDLPEERGMSVESIDIEVDGLKFTNFKLGSRRSREHTFAVMSQAVRNATQGKGDGSNWYGLHVVFNCMSRKFELVLGVKNSQLIEWAKQDEPERAKRGNVGGKHNEVTVLESKLRNAFAMLEDDGSPAGSSRISQYRGKFDPNFFPQRFVLRDCIVEQRPKILSLLMAHICERYERSGVYYIELSASAKDLLNPTFWHHVTTAYQTTLKGLSMDVSDQKKLRLAPSPLPTSRGDSAQSGIPMEEDDEQAKKRMRLAAEEKLQLSYGAQGEQLQGRTGTLLQTQPTLDSRTGTLRSNVTSKSFITSSGPYAEVPWMSTRARETSKPRGQIALFLAAFTRDISLAFFEEEAKTVLGSKGALPQYIKDTVVQLCGEESLSLLEKQHDLDPTIRDSILSVVGHALVRFWFVDPAAWLNHIAEKLDASKCRWEDIFADQRMLEKMFPRVIEHIQRMLMILRYRKGDKIEGSEDEVIIPFIQAKLRDFCVGFDLVGCEAGRPFSPFLHPDAKELITEFIKLETSLKMRRSAFGIRFHCGELVPRRVAKSEKSDPGLVAHLQVTIATIEELSKIFKQLRFRIGHGVAFLHKVSDEGLQGKMESMIQVLVNKKIPIEVNLSSNNILVADTFVHQEFGPEDALKALKELGLRLILSTDDDGILPIYDCKAHGRHISVSREFCLAIETKLLATTQDIESLICTAINSAFIFPRKKLRSNFEQIEEKDDSEDDQEDEFHDFVDE